MTDVTTLTAHEMQFAKEAADRVYYIEEGRWIEIGPPEQVIDSPRDQRTRQFLARFLGSAHRHGDGSIHEPEQPIHIHEDEGPSHAHEPHHEHDHQLHDESDHVVNRREPVDPTDLDHEIERGRHH